jgi:hypothetical protein
MNKQLVEQRSEADTAKLAEPLIAGEYIKPEQLAEELGISLRSLARWHSLRVGPPRVVIGRIILFRRAAVAEWLRAREEQTRRRSR